MNIAPANRRSKQLQLPVHHEINVDLFAGGGGASVGFEMAMGYSVDIAVNHNPKALGMHAVNHPHAKHYISNVFDVSPREVTQGRPVGGLWASPDCTYHSKARGAAPFRDRNKARRRRGLAGVVIKWAKEVKPRQIWVENVEEFKDWGPLTEDGLPCPKRKGTSFKRWIARLENLGYEVQFRELRACDYGAPTTRKRLFIIARCDGSPIVWPTPTHGDPKTAKALGLLPWRTAADCIDWSLPTNSIFERKKPLADATLRRIAKGMQRYVIDADQPFIAPVGDGTSQVSTLIQTGYGERKGQSPRVPGLEKPLGTVMATGQKHALVTAFLAKHYGGVVGTRLGQPLGTITSIDHHSLVTANLIHMGHGEGKRGGKRFSHGIRDIRDPLNTVTASGVPAGIVTTHIMKMRGTNVGSSMNEPLHTISAQGTHHALVMALLKEHIPGSTDSDFIVWINAEPYIIVDICLRMLQPHELYAAQSFPADYVITHDGNGEPFTKAEQIQMCGNSVSPCVAQAIIQSNYVQSIPLRRAA